MPAPKVVYRLKITIKDIRPPIWRRIEVPGDIHLGKLHQVLQDALGWTNSHLHQYVIGRTFVGVPSRESSYAVVNEKKVRLGEIAKARSRFVYEYDFGDGWEHEVVVERVAPAEPGVRYPRCLGGKRACPPEDCGGSGGYEHLLEVLADPKHEEHEELMDWIGGPFDPEAFDLEETDDLLRSSSRSRQLGWLLK